MAHYQDAVSTTPASLPRPALVRMIRLVRTLHRLSHLPAYRQLVESQVPETARFDPGHDAVMMGYDFHLAPTGPQLIEVNTNAGGGLLAYLAQVPGSVLAGNPLPTRLKNQLLTSFAAEMRAFSDGRSDRPRRIAILDERPEEQYLYGEMEAFAELFTANWGVPTIIRDPSGLDGGPEGVYSDGLPVDLIYNRHCDFYLERPELAGLRAAYRAKTVCLTPNPFVYGLLADKRRLVLWSDPVTLAKVGLPQRDVELITALVPVSRLLANGDPEDFWTRRDDLVFKPVSRFGSRGVLLGRKISRSRFNTLLSEETLVQQLVPPSLTPADGQEPFKTDFRLYAYRNQVLGVAARLYHGQVTNLRTPGGGFAAVRLV